LLVNQFGFGGTCLSLTIKYFSGREYNQAKAEEKLKGGLWGWQMGRGRRICYPGAFFHCINRGNRREKIFWEEEDYEQMLKCLGEACKRYDVLVHGFCLIPNHYHLLLQQQEQPVSSAMRSLGTNYATYFNRKYHKVGHVFQGRYRGILCDKPAYLLSLIRYIHLNPMRAGLVERAQDLGVEQFASLLGDE
jgi:putative transposase